MDPLAISQIIIFCANGILIPDISTPPTILQIEQYLIITTLIMSMKCFLHYHNVIMLP